MEELTFLLWMSQLTSLITKGLVPLFIYIYIISHDIPMIDISPLHLICPLVLGQPVHQLLIQTQLCPTIIADNHSLWIQTLSEKVRLTT